MKSHLTHGQRALLRADLEQRKAQLSRRLSDHQGGHSRAEYERELATQDDDDAPQREGERELDHALTEFESASLREVGQALARIDTEAYGVCSDCGCEIPFDRLRAEPWAGRCVSCESRREREALRRA